MTARIVAAIAAMVVMMSCGRSGKGSDGRDTDLLMSVGDSTLYEHDVVRLIPVAMTPDDSLALFNSIVANWRDSHIIERYAEEYIDNLEEIDQMTADYRRRLISESYRRKLRQIGAREISQEEIQRYYNSHRDEMVLEAPVLKGVFLKIPANAANLKEIRKWVFSGKPDGIDNLEKFGLTDAVQYTFFQDRWVDWSVVESLIPYRFGDAEAFLKANRNFETSSNGVIYLLHVANYLPSGRPMPYDYAAGVISETLAADGSTAYERRMLQDMTRQARKEGYLIEYNRPKTIQQ